MLMLGLSRAALPLYILAAASVALFFTPFVVHAQGETLHIDGGDAFGWDEDRWYVQVDGVMGGKSTGYMDFLDSGADKGINNVLQFTGTIDLDGGGFSSVRRRDSLDLSGYSGLVVTVQAERYDSACNSGSCNLGRASPTGLHLQLGDSTSRYSFSSALAVPLSAGSNATNNDVIFASVYLPMEGFDRGTAFGFVCQNNCEFDDSKINDISIYVLFQEGDFDVRVKSIEAVTEPQSFPSPTIDTLQSADDVIELLESTIESGGGLYDKSYIELCIALYWSVLNTILASSSSSMGSSSYVLPKPTHVVICSGLQRAEGIVNGMLSSEEADVSTRIGAKQDAAWTLRYVMDTVIADLKGVARTNNFDWLPTSEEGGEESVEATCVARTSIFGGSAAVDDATENTSTVATAGSDPSIISQDGRSTNSGHSNTCENRTTFLYVITALTFISHFT